jgi:hypothetical protein
MSGEDSGSHGKYARPVLLKLPAAVGDHGQNLFIMLAAEQGVSGDHRALLSAVDNDGSVPGNVTRGEKALQVTRQGMPFNPPELGRAAQSLGIPPAQRQFPEFSH